jgi:predicted transcriptional regulator
VSPHAAAAELIENLGPDLTRKRMRRNLTVPEAAKQIGVTSATLTKLEAGTSNPTRSTIVSALRWLAS